ncbi:hypothetical protein AG1IA_00243 [Rhizoctonia solani AG-1 IA]|uniref:Uncharacterized protein n=1 Tax=Thanatephorus cucumeris (strain AG1-IA) TaxID=983506 RepID=L8X602_THACA|nr:hypothetical protein AG1IA_00243 [Rhizoctonia solani AG-1 IA]
MRRQDYEYTNVIKVLVMFSHNKWIDLFIRVIIIERALEQHLRGARPCPASAGASGPRKRAGVGTRTGAGARARPAPGPGCTSRRCRICCECDSESEYRTSGA